MSLILTDFNEYIGTITFNNNCKRNALSAALIHDLIKALNEMIYQEARVIILRANPRPPCGRQATTSPNSQARPGPAVLQRPPGAGHPALQRCPAPVIAMLGGSVWGGACEVAMVCDILIGTEKATFAITPPAWGCLTIPPASSTSSTCWA